MTPERATASEVILAASEIRAIIAEAFGEVPACLGKVDASVARWLQIRLYRTLFMNPSAVGSIRTLAAAAPDAPGISITR